ncbi:MAG: hypothetical protein COU47_02580 [Candidatus Niyogibacteria bacterium CG10_big_fil_rev_8_21_14_0_10_46_36]|uniref:DUF192 domain-containing protein n=1 Tax=Candidatus Niyogibacteria bacterium CG10_big_fil_rev_8_21_14_0_10_46_36 TaxID=1974726 RepID=A0A2H0TDI3_9BACT|nr:MAG: hypothetical protein COU47_02580 [Candidatus Niyogibacteria bacterium CG10_big_fil_rev_8_21_14_0_10_46_36]
MENKSPLKERFFAFLLIIGLAFAFLVLLRKGNETTATETATVSIRDAVVAVEIADTSEERALGLGGRNHMKENEGMFFIFEKPGYYPFWMKNMEFPLDIIWIGDDFTITHIEHGVSPDTFPNQYVSEKPAQYVLEVHKGFSEDYAFSVGDAVIFNRNGVISE